MFITANYNLETAPICAIRFSIIKLYFDILSVAIRGKTIYYDSSFKRQQAQQERQFSNEFSHLLNECNTTVPVCGKKHKALNGKAKILNASLKPCQTLSQLREIHSFLLLNLNSIILTYSVMMITMKEIKLFIYNNMLSLQ